MSYKEPTPPDTELVVRSHVVAVRENQNPGLGKAAVEVDVAILLPQADGSEKLLVQVGQGVWERGEVCVGWGAGGRACQPGCARLAGMGSNGRVARVLSPVNTLVACGGYKQQRRACVCVCVVLARSVQGTGIFKRLGALRAL